MPITVNSNSSATAASFYLTRNNRVIKSINRLSSGSRIVQPNDDAGGLAVSMKPKARSHALKLPKRIFECDFIS